MDIEEVIEKFAYSGDPELFNQLWEQYNQRYNKSDWVLIPDLARMDTWSQNAFRNLLKEYINEKYGDKFERLIKVLDPFIQLVSINNGKDHVRNTDLFKKVKMACNHLKDT